MEFLIATLPVLLAIASPVEWMQAAAPGVVWLPDFHDGHEASVDQRHYYRRFVALVHSIDGMVVGVVVAGMSTTAGQSQIHIVLISRYPLPGRATSGGVQRVVRTFREALSAHAKVTLIAWDAEDDMYHRDEFGSILYLKKTFKPNLLSYWSLTSSRLLHVIEMLEPDIVHVHDMAGLARQWPGKRSKRPFRTVFTAHSEPRSDLMSLPGTDFLRRHTKHVRAALIAEIERRAVRRFDRIFVINEYVVRAIPELEKMSRDFVPNPVDPVFVDTPLAPKPASPVRQLLKVGVINERKNPMAAIRIAHELITSGVKVHLNVVGPIDDRDYCGRCIDLARHLRISESVTFHGAATSAEIVRFMDRADVLLVLSQRETAPLVVAEAHCRGLPTVIPRAFGLVSMVEAGVNGAFLDLKAPTTHAAVVRDALTREWDRTRIRQTAIDAYGLDRIIDRTLSIYARLIAEDRDRPADPPHSDDRTSGSGGGLDISMGKPRGPARGSYYVSNEPS